MKENQSVNINSDASAETCKTYYQTNRMVHLTEFWRRLHNIKKWFNEFNDEQRNLLLKDLLRQCKQSQVHVLSMLMEGHLHEGCLFNCMDPFVTLPESISNHILSFCSPETLCISSKVNRKWSQLSNNADLWRNICRSHAWCEDDIDNTTITNNKNNYDDDDDGEDDDDDTNISYDNGVDYNTDKKDGFMEVDNNTGQKDSVIKVYYDNKEGVINSDIDRITMDFKGSNSIDNNIGESFFNDIEGNDNNSYSNQGEVYKNKKTENNLKMDVSNDSGGNADHGCKDEGTTSSTNQPNDRKSSERKSDDLTKVYVNKYIKNNNKGFTNSKTKGTVGRLNKRESKHEDLNTNTQTNFPRYLNNRWKKHYVERYKLRRNWLTGRCNVRTFSGHTQGISCVQFDETRIVSGSSDGTIKVWDIKTNSLWSVQTLLGHSGKIRCLHLDRNRLVSGSTDLSIKVWDISTKDNWASIACKVTMQGHTDTVRCLEADDKRVISGSYDTTLKLWDIQTGVCQKTFRGHEGAVLCVHFDNDQILSGSADNKIKVWTFTGECLSTLEGHKDAVTCLRLVGGRVVSGSLDCTLRFWCLESGQCTKVIDWQASEGHTRVVRCLQVDKSKVVSASDDKTIKVWSLDTGQRLVTLRKHTDGVTCVQFNDKVLVSGSYDKTVKLWDFSCC